MTRQKYLQAIAYWQKQVSYANAQKEKVKIDYIKANAFYPIGSELKIDHIGKEKNVRIQSYDIDENGVLFPVFETLEGKALFVEKATIIDLLKDKK